jgi:hypothetical protein
VIDNGFKRVESFISAMSEMFLFDSNSNTNYLIQTNIKNNSYCIDTNISEKASDYEDDKESPLSHNKSITGNVIGELNHYGIFNLFE